MANPSLTNRLVSTSNKSALCAEYLIANPHASNAQVANAIGCSTNTVSSARRKLVGRGLIPRSYYDSTSPETLTPLTTEGAEEIQQQLAKMRGETGEPLTTEEKLRMLSAFARKAQLDGNMKAATDAIVAHTRIEEKTTSAQLGPGPPLTRDDKVARMKVLVDVVGSSVLAEAAHTAHLADCFDLPSFEEELSRLKATHSLAEPGATFQAASSPLDIPSEAEGEDEEV